MNERLQLLAARLVAVREEERTRIAREIHDELGQELTSCKFDVVWLQNHVGDPAATPAVRNRLHELLQHVDGTLQSVRRIALELRPSALDHLGLVDAIRDEARRFQYRTGIATRLDIADRLGDIDADLGTTCFRIFQELLTNVARHARANIVEVSLTFDQGELVLRVRDDGVGLDGSTRTGAPPLGIIGMQERAAAHGGSITFDSELGRGTGVVVRLATTERIRSIAC
jgi:signal transduction histidine kinase